MDIVGHVRSVAPALQTGLRRTPTIRSQGRCADWGWCPGWNLCEQGGREPFAPELNLGLFIERRCQDRGAILRALGDTLTVAPPLVVDEETIGMLVKSR